MNENFEKYIKDLPPELREKASECKTIEELNEFVAENDIELPEEALELVSGGCGSSAPPPQKGDPVPGKVCPDCSRQLYFYADFIGNIMYYCNNSSCGKYYRYTETLTLVFADRGDHLDVTYITRNVD
ncbi:MAG: hypothetical protein K6C68_10445 [Ruminococcus sp.]|nr:hypothetical protein [Ruminococcus sp.]